MDGTEVKYDVLIIGGGVTGSAIAWALSRYDLSICLIDKESDLCEGTSKANSGIIHAGYDPVPGTLKALLNVMGNKIIHDIADQLSIDFIGNGALVAAFSDSEARGLETLLQRGKDNGVPSPVILSRDEVLAKERNISSDVKAALYLPSSGIICPFSLTYALAENAVSNGVAIRLAEKVIGMTEHDGIFHIATDKNMIEARCVINAAGVYADSIHNMVCDESFSIMPRRGEYVLLDKVCSSIVSSTIFQMPTARGKGVLVTPTAHGNILCGPDSTEIRDREDTSTDSGTLAYVMESALKSVPSIDFRKIITSFAGLRAHPSSDDFIIGMARPGFIDAAGIESPGLSSAPAIGKMVSEIAVDYLKARRKSHVIEERKAIPKLRDLSYEERDRLISADPRYGNIICRCEEISEGEIVDAIRRGATTLDGVKRRVRAGMGRCQGGFCTPRVMAIISRETGIGMDAVCKNGKGSEVLSCEMS